MHIPKRLAKCLNGQQYICVLCLKCCLISKRMAKDKEECRVKRLLCMMKLCCPFAKSKFVLHFIDLF